MDTKYIRSESIQAAKALGIPIAALPFLDDNPGIRTEAEVISRLLTLHSLVASSFGFPKSKALAWLEQESLRECLLPKEAAFIADGQGAGIQYQSEVEAMWALSWCLGIVDQMNFTQRCSPSFVHLLPNLKVSESSQAFRQKVHFRDQLEIMQMCDLAYCLHWAIRDSQLKARPMRKLEEPVVSERRHALEWVIGKDAWDAISLDT